jgi:hypothetical protein
MSEQTTCPYKKKMQNSERCEIRDDGNIHGTSFLYSRVLKSKKPDLVGEEGASPHVEQVGGFISLRTGER